jgi:invasion protein IalB
MMAIAVGSVAFAQVPPAAQQKAAPVKPPPATPATPATPKAGATTQQKPGDAPAPSDAGQPPQLVFSAWEKVCKNAQETNGQPFCYTAKDGRFESGMLAISAALIEPEADQRKILRVTLPLGVLLPQGTRVIVDQGQPMSAPYVICLLNGCVAEYEASAELVGKMKKGQGLMVQGVGAQGQVVSLGVPLTDFSKAYDGPPTDQKVFEDQQKKLQDDLQRRAEEARKKLEGQPPPSTR